jgi:hypothetical protein
MKIKYFFLIFVAIGTPFLLKGLHTGFNNYTFKQKAQKATGYVVGFRHARRRRSGLAPVVEYRTPDGVAHRYESSTFYSPSTYDLNEAVVVYFDPKKPNEATFGGFLDEWLEPLILGCIGGAFIAFGWAGFFVSWRREKKSNEIMVTGKPILADYLGVRKDFSYKVNGRSPYVIRAQWINPQTQEVHVFESDHIWFDPSPYIKTKQIKVKIDPHDASKYWMNIRFLPQKAK